jgi:hypothetical protein
VKILCPEHGEFSQWATAHLQGHGCARCGKHSASQLLFYTLDECIDKFKTKHGDRYDYSLVDYKKSHSKVIIICPQHGQFKQQASSHWMGSGCPSCVHQYSKPHKEIEAYLDSLGVSYQSNTRSIIPPKELDIWIPSHNLAIEFNGDYWHSIGPKSLKNDHLKHQQKFLACQEKGIVLLQIEENEWNDVEGQERWKNVMCIALGDAPSSINYSEILLDNRYGEWFHYKDTHILAENLPPNFKWINKGSLRLYDAGYQRWVLKISLTGSPMGW